MKNLIILLKREFKMFFTNTTLLMTFFLAPVIYAVMLASVYKSGKTTELPVVVVDRDNSPMSTQVIEMLNDNEGIEVIKVLAESNDVQSEMIERQATAVVVIPDRFEADVLTAKHPELMIYVNTVNMLTANFASKSVQTSLGTLSAGIEIKGLQKRGMPGYSAVDKYEPFKQNYVRVFNETGNYFSFMWPPMMAVVLQQVILLAMAVSIAYEVEKNTFGIGIVKKTKSALVTVFVKVFPLWVLSIPVILIFYGFHHFFNAPIPAHPMNFIGISALFIVSATLLGTVISALIPNALKATQILMLMSAPGFIIGGYTWPTFAMAKPIQLLADILPLTPFVNAFKLLLMEGASVHQVQPYLLQLALQIACYSVLSLLLVKWRIKKEEKALLVKN
ncbi:MAG: ABC transporter permease [Flavobacteriia bacterium]|nr:ABC transporter permease [Flavobacteriia bacterium]OJX39158.1 MAG: ABC transporter permease [Flavobacteriia bacterium 40-80]